MKKYCVVGGMVTSQSDGDEHYIPPYELCRLYGVNPEECYLHSNQDLFEINRRGQPDLPILRPRYDGRYKEELLELEKGV